jgi:DNA-binding transcriptional MerR regulator
MKRADNQLLKIGDVARLMGVRAQTIRNYEQQGLLKPAGRSKAGHRLYGAYEVAQLRFMKRANLAGITKAEVKELLPLIAQGERGEDLPRLKEVLEEKLGEIE